MTDLPVPKYAIGAVVYHPEVRSSAEYVPCPDCLGKRTWHAALPNGEELDFLCPTCTRGYETTGTVHSWEVQGSVRELTIASVRIDTNEANPVEYMCYETGVGSGQVWSEHLLHADRETAEALLPKLIEERRWQLIESRATDRKRKIEDGPGRMVAHYRAEIRDAKKTIEDCERGLAREMGQR